MHAPLVCTGHVISHLACSAYVHVYTSVKIIILQHSNHVQVLVPATQHPSPRPRLHLSWILRAPRALPRRCTSTDQNAIQFKHNVNDVSSIGPPQSGAVRVWPRPPRPRHERRKEGLHRRRGGLCGGPQGALSGKCRPPQMLILVEQYMHNRKRRMFFSISLIWKEIHW